MDVAFGQRLFEFINLSIGEVIYALSLSSLLHRVGSVFPLLTG